MNLKAMTASILSGLLLVAVISPDADAATVRVKCEKRGTTRSKVSVDGNDLVPGQYKCRVMSGGNTATTGLKNTIGDELECDFDSNPADIAAGATRISRNFIQGGQVTGKILTPTGSTVISDTVNCRVR
jgi:hypothetical protein